MLNSEQTHTNLLLIRSKNVNWSLKMEDIIEIHKLFALLIILLLALNKLYTTEIISEIFWSVRYEITTFWLWQHKIYHDCKEIIFALNILLIGTCKICTITTLISKTLKFLTKIAGNQLLKMVLFITWFMILQIFPNRKRWDNWC